MKEALSSSRDIFYKIAVSSLIVSSITVIVLVISAPLLYYKANIQRDDITFKSERFREDTNRIWQSFKIIPEDLSPMQFFTRKARSVWDKQICSGCNQLGCPTGGPGSSGPPGEDGSPGNAGKPGPTGADGYDVELEPENDLPCVICPAGPPGERGQPGYPGMQGMGGPPGTQGVDGPPGNFGPLGNPGKKGVLGPIGEPGDTIIAGIGIKGPKGPPGPAGPKGPHGPNGKASKEQGMPGRPGTPGGIGPVGGYGRPGEKGGWGPPGEPGQPAAYCPSDCGVSQILAPALHTINKSMQSQMNEEVIEEDSNKEKAYGNEAVKTQDSLDVNPYENKPAASTNNNYETSVVENPTKPKKQNPYEQNRSRQESVQMNQGIPHVSPPSQEPTNNVNIQATQKPTEIKPAEVNPYDANNAPSAQIPANSNYETPATNAEAPKKVEEAPNPYDKGVQANANPSKSTNESPENSYSQASSTSTKHEETEVAPKVPSYPPRAIEENPYAKEVHHSPAQTDERELAPPSSGQENPYAGVPAPEIPIDKLAELSSQTTYQHANGYYG